MMHFLSGLGHYALTWSWQLAILVAFLWIVLRFDRRHRPAMRYRLLFLTLVLSLLLPWLPSKIAAYSWTARIKEVWLEPVAPLARTLPRRNAGLLESTAGAFVSLPSPPAQTSRSTALELETLFPALGFLWVAGTAIAAIRKLRQHRRFAGIVRRSEVSPLGNDTSVPILLSDQISVPMLYGMWRPVILLPLRISEWSTSEERAAVIRHEFVHFKRRDYWVCSLEGLLRTILFFHPMVRWMCKSLDIERELVCDAEVLRLGSDPDVYASTLLKVAQHAVAQPSGVYFASATRLRERVELLARPHKTARIALAAVPLILLTPLVSLGFWHATVEEVAPPESSWSLRFIPRIPLQAVAAPVASVVLLPPPIQVPTELQQIVVSNPTIEPRSRPVSTAVTVLRGQGVLNEVRITVSIPYANLTFSRHPFLNYLEAEGRIEGQISSLSGKVIARLEEPFSVLLPPGNGSPSKDGIAYLQHAFLIGPGAYRFFVLFRDSATGTMGTLDKRFEIPMIARNGVSTSSLVLADLIENQPTQPNLNIFDIGNLRVRPNVTGRFRQNQELNIFQQVYTDGSGPLVVETLITLNGQEFRRFSDEFQKAPELTITKRVPLADFPPGTYGIQTIVTDPVGPQAVSSRAEFTVE